MILYKKDQPLHTTHDLENEIYSSPYFGTTKREKNCNAIELQENLGCSATTLETQSS